MLLTGLQILYFLLKKYINMGSTQAQWLNFEQPYLKPAGFFLCGVWMISPCPYVFPLVANLESLIWYECVVCLSVCLSALLVWSAADLSRVQPLQWMIGQVTAPVSGSLHALFSKWLQFWDAKLQLLQWGTVKTRASVNTSVNWVSFQSIKCQKAVNIVQHKLPDPNMISSNSLFFPIHSPTF